METLWEEEGFQFGFKDDRVEQCLRSCGSEFQMWGPKQEKVQKAMSLAFVPLDFQHAGVSMRVPVYLENVTKVKNINTSK